MMNSDDTTSDKPPNGRTNTKVVPLLQRLKQAIWRRRPILGAIMAKHGDKTLYRYAQDFMDVNKSELPARRQHELIDTAQLLLAERLGADVAAGVARQLKKIPLVSTADHHGSIDHPFWVNSNLISAIPYLQNSDPDLRYLVVFSFASVSVNNASVYPRGIQFHGGVNGRGNFIRLPILPDKLKMGVVYGTRSYTREDLTKAENELFKKEKEEMIAAGRAEKIRRLLETYFATPAVLDVPDLATQVTKINISLWPKLFHPVVKPVPDLVYLEIETLVRELLIKYHLNNPSSLVYRLFFDAQFQSLALKYFEKIPGAFSVADEWGTYCFWAVDEKLHRVRLELCGDQLLSRERGISFSLNPETIVTALREKKIFPSMMLCYLLVSLYYGMKCLGGFSQVNDLTFTKEAWKKLLTEVGEIKESEALTPLQTKEMGGDGMVLAYFKTSPLSLVPATGIDMAIEEDIDTRFEHYVELSKRVTLNEMMNPMLLEIYTVLYASHQRDPQFMKLSPELILQTTGLQKQLVS